MDRRGDLERRKLGWQSPGDLEERELTIAGIRRTYWLARAHAPNAPLLIVLHGSGMTGRAMAKFTGLGMRGPAAGTRAQSGRRAVPVHAERAPGGNRGGAGVAGVSGRGIERRAVRRAR